MKRLIFLFAVMLVTKATFAQTNWKEKIVGKWKYDGTEEFGVVTKADSTRAGDWLQLNADGTFARSEKSNETNGTYKLDETNKTLTLKDASGKSQLMYLKKSDPGTLTVETQTKDLVRTRHRYSAMP